MSYNSLISLKIYLSKGNKFLIPNYQRGYIWGKKRSDETENSVKYLIKSIIHNYPQKELFLQGITVSEYEHKELELIDGQQRTTFFYLLLCYLGYENNFNIDYQIRTQSKEFLKSLQKKSETEILSLCEESQQEEFQDIYYFKKTIRDIHETLKDIPNKKEIVDYLIHKEKVKFLYINIPKEKATAVFTMMNGNRAVMKTEEVIKAEILRLISLSSKTKRIDGEPMSDKEKNEELEALRWDQNLTRNKYAREWDKWLCWWNREDVQQFYQCNNVMGILIATLFGDINTLSYENFKNEMLRGIESDTLTAKNTYIRLRNLQKKFEDVFNNYEDHNKVGAILNLLSTKDKDKFLHYYFTQPKDPDNLEKYLKLAYLGMSHSDIEKELKNNLQGCSTNTQVIIQDVYSQLDDDYIYLNSYETAYRQLLRRNIQEEIKMGRKFDFRICKEKSIEHIYPKSKVYHEENGLLKTGADEITSIGLIQQSTEYLDRDLFNKNGSEHCIGNLVLLYGCDNSSFNNSTFEGKKLIYFNLGRLTGFKSRNLLHTLSIFSKNQWGVIEIQENKNHFIKEVENYYGLSKN